MKRKNNWYLYAKDDLTVARAAYNEKVYNLACFHAQQGVEKLLKGFIVANKLEAKRTHSLGELLQSCLSIDESLAPFIEKCNKLDDYYIPTRYPDALPGAYPEGLPNRNDAKEAIGILEELMTVFDLGH